MAKSTVDKPSTERVQPICLLELQYILGALRYNPEGRGLDSR